MSKEPQIISALERRKIALKKFYQKVDPERIKNVDPLFEHFSFKLIAEAIQKKYKSLPDNWEYERYYDLIGHLSEKKIIVAMKKQHLDPSVLFSNAKTRKNSIAFGSQFNPGRESFEFLSNEEIENNPPPLPPGPPPRKASTSKVKIRKEPKTPKSKLPEKSDIIIVENESDDDDIAAMFNLAPPESIRQTNIAGHADFCVRPTNIIANPPRQTEMSKKPPPPPSYDSPGAPPARQTQALRSTKPPPPPTPSPAETAANLAAKLPFGQPKTEKENVNVSNEAPRKTEIKQTKVEIKLPPKPSQLEIKLNVPPPPPPVVSKEEEGPKTESGADLSKYRKMKKAGLPNGAIINCMARDGVDTALFDKLDADDAPEEPKAPEVKAQSEVKSMDKSSSAPVMAVSVPKSPPPGPMKRSNTALNAKFGKMHTKLLDMHGLGEKKEAPKPEMRQPTAISSKFGAMHAKLGLQLAGAGGGGAAKGKTAEEKKADEEKAKNVADKFAQMAKAKELKVYPIDSPEYDKYRKMQKNKLPEGAIRNCLERDGLDPDAFFNPAAAPVATPAPEPVVQQIIPTNNLNETSKSVHQMPQNGNLQQQSTQPQLVNQSGSQMNVNQQQQQQYNYNQQQQQPQQQQYYPQQQQQQYYDPNQVYYDQYGNPTQMQSYPSQYTVQQQQQYYGTGPMVGGSQVHNGGWTVQWSDDYKLPYYFNTITGQSSWEPPPELSGQGQQQQQQQQMQGGYYRQQY